METIRLWPKRSLFLLKAHSLTIFIMLLTTFYLEAFLIKKRFTYERKKLVIVGQNYVALYYIVLSFWGFLSLTYFRKTMKNFYWWINLLSMAGMVWWSCPLLFLSLLSSKYWEWLYAGYVTIGLMIVHSIFAMSQMPFYEFTSDFLIRWSIRGMVFSFLGLIASIALKSTHLGIITSYFSLLFHAVLIILIGRTSGSIEFYIQEIKSNEWYYMILMHYNFMIDYALMIFASCKTRSILSQGKQT